MQIPEGAFCYVKMWISGMSDIPERETSLPCLPSSSSPLERKTKRKKQRKDKRKIYPYYHHPSYPISSSPPAVDTGASVVTAVWTYVGELAFNLLVLVGAIKGCDRIVKEIMGL